jgi:hypothetical protein
MPRKAVGRPGKRKLVLAAALVLATTSPAHVLEEQKGERQVIEACDKRLCGILVGKNPSGADLKCALTKTWARSTLKEGDSAKLSWAFGDARCSVDLQVGRAAIVTAMTSSKPYKFWVPPHTANCLIEQDGQLKAIKATVAPKIVFKDGKAEKIWINLKEVEGPSGLRDWLVTAAQLTDSLGIFHRAMIRSVNRYIERHCPKHAPQARTGKADADK